MFLFFMGIIVMFWYVLRRMDEHYHVLAEEHAQLRVILRALESRVNCLLPESEPVKAADAVENSAQDPLLHLSFDQPTDPLMDNKGLDLHFDPQNPRSL